jgi:hypothetical protein
MIDGPYRQTVYVSGKPCEVSVVRRSKSVWEVTGNGPDGKAYPPVKDRSRNTAVRSWAKMVEYHYHQN